MMAVSSMPISESVVFIYPRIFALHTADPQSNELPARIRCTIDKFEDSGAYLLGKFIININKKNSWISNN